MAMKFLAKIVEMTSVFVSLFLYLRSCVLFVPHYEELQLPSTGPVSYFFDHNGGGPYTGLSDGTIVQYRGSQIGFVPYAFTSANRSKALCDGTNTTYLGHICGRPISARFYNRTGQLYIADAYKGLCVVGSKGGLATQLVTGAEGVPFRLLEGIDIDQATGIIYITDASSVYNLSELSQIISTGDATGRLMKYNSKTKQVTVLLSGLAGAASVAISQDGSFLLVNEFNRKRIQKYWLKGSKANTAEILLNFTGNPTKITRTVRGDFWVGINVQTETTPILTGQKFSGSGIILENLTFSPQFNTRMITEVHEHKNALYLGSLTVDYVDVYKL